MKNLPDTWKEFKEGLIRFKKDDSDRLHYDILDDERWWSIHAERSFKNLKDAKEFYEEEKPAYVVMCSETGSHYEK